MSRRPNDVMGLEVAIVSDERYLLHKTGHFHPEHPARLSAVLRMLDRSYPDFPRIEPRPATLEELERVHFPAYLEQVMLTASHRFTSLAPDTPVSADTYKTAHLAAGGCISAADALVAGRFDAAFALVRPPGHHATADRAGGFCIINNIAVTAAHLAAVYGVERILVVDFDVHFGNGIASIFHGSRNVLYVSSHDPLLFPYSGDLDDVGSGGGRGYTVCIPFSRQVSGKDLAVIYSDLLGRITENYRPEAIIAAAGFDAHADDPIGRCSFTEDFFRDITAILARAAQKGQGRIPLLFVLEGGYNPGALARCVETVLLTLLDPRKPDLPESLGPDAADLLERIIKTHTGFGVLE